MEQSGTVLPVILEERCTACGDCVEACPKDALELQEGRVVLGRPEDCAYCGDCETLCPSGAIALPFEIGFAEDTLDRLLDNGLYKGIIDNLYDGVYVVGPDRQILYWNRGAERLTGFLASDVVGLRCRDNILVHINEQGEVLCTTSCPVAETIADGCFREADVYLHHKDGHRVPVLVRVVPIRDAHGRVAGAAEVFSDNSIQLALETQVEQLQRTALLDALTGIGNRRHGDIHLQAKLEELRRHGLPFGVLFVDIDHFKRINDTHGHDVGDRVLRMVARTLSLNMRSFDLVSRWGGEEILVIVGNVDDGQLYSAAGKLRRLVEQSGLQVGSQVVRVTVSIGATMARPDDTVDSLVQRVDQLMYQSKLSGRNRVTAG